MATDPNLLLAFYGDDFTGSTDAMEALSVSGLRTVLFLSSPSPELIREKFPDLRCVGVAGTSRAMSPAEMDTEFEPVLQQLWKLGAPVTHYKVCSTFDSSPTIGSIGHVADMAHKALVAGQVISILAGAPPLRRFTVFGNHYAAYGDEIYRLDRHPVMSRHPSTPMHESDLRVHLSHQTRTSIELMSVTDLSGEDAQVDTRELQRLATKPGMLLYDALTNEHLSTVGRLMWKHGKTAPHFVVGSSGVEYALAAHWRETGVISNQRKQFPPIKAVKQLLAVSGSASPMTAQQIEWAGKNGFDCIRIPTDKLVQPGKAAQAERELIKQGLAALSAGNSVLLYSAAGPDDPSIKATREQLGKDTGGSARVLGAAMGRVTRELVSKTGLRRVVIAGGDTSSYATQELKLYALEMLAELTPGAPLCRAYSDDPQFDGLEIALKGGQMGRVDYFGMVRG